MPWAILCFLAQLWKLRLAPLRPSSEKVSARGERVALLQHILGVIGIDAREDMVVDAGVGVEAQLIVAAVFKRGAYHAPLVLPWLSVEREHDFRMRGVGVAHAVLVLDHLHAVK